MSDSGSNNNAIVAIVAIIVIVGAAFFAYQKGMFNSHEEKSGANFELHVN